MKKVNEIAVARKAIKAAIKSGEVLRDSSAMHRVGIEAIAEFCSNATVASELAWQATKDVLFAA